jgi:prepilin-type processing-associated H-X9-DG protein
MLVYSEAAYHREAATLKKQVAQAQKQASKALASLRHHEFDTPCAAGAALAALEAEWLFHRALVRIETVPHYGHRGRPKTGEVPKHLGFRIVGQIVERTSAIEAAKQNKGKFVLATNELNPELLDAETILGVYKGQGVSVERGFRFLKDSLCFQFVLGKARANYGFVDGHGVELVSVCLGRTLGPHGIGATGANDTQSRG